MSIKKFPAEAREIYQTKHYEIFKKVKGNRGVDANRVNKIKNSIIENGYICNPIIVNEKMEVIDGQGRLEALELLGLPVDYIIVPGTGVVECTAMNIASTNWSLTDYIDSYATIGNENYINIQKLINKYKGVINVSTVVGVALGHNNGKAIRKQVISEKAICGNNEMAYAARRLDWLAEMKPIFKKCSNKDTLQSCLLSIFNMEGVDRERLKNRLLDCGSVTGYSTIDDCLDVLSEIYNYRLRAESKVDFKHYYKFKVPLEDPKNRWCA